MRHSMVWLCHIYEFAATPCRGKGCSRNVLIGKAIIEGNGDVAQYWQNVMANAYAGLLQIVLLAIVTIVSVYKPWKRKGH